DSYDAQRALFQELVKPINDPLERTRVIEAATKGAERAAREHAELTVERRKVFGDNPNVPAQEAKTLARSDQMLTRLQEGEAELRKFLEKQEEIAKDEPERQAWAREFVRAKRLEDNLELGQAIDIYKKLAEQAEQKNYPEKGEAKKRLDAAKEQWQ